MPANRETQFVGGWSRRNGHSDSNLSLSLSSSPLSSPRSTPYNSKHGSPSSYPSSPVSTSPIPIPPTLQSLRRTYSSTFMLIPEDREIDIVKQPYQKEADEEEPSLRVVLIRIAFWWPLFLSRLALLILSVVLKFLFVPFSFAAPSFWLSALLWVFWKALAFPISIINWIITPAADHDQKKRTILITCGSTIQALHLARNFYSSGARVIVIEFEGLFGLARFSSAVSKFYTVPKPTPDSAQDYIASLCEIVEKEKPTHFVPVCATNSSYYDSLAKPHLELLGCATFIPGMQENLILDDILEVFKICSVNAMSLPPFKLLTSKEDLFKLYDVGWMVGCRNILVAVGAQGVLERHKFVLPQYRQDLKLTLEISDDKPWIVIRCVPGKHYITCTTIKDSKIVANVTCLVNQDTKNLIPEEKKEISTWLHNFFHKVRFPRQVNAHISFRFIKCEATGDLLPIGSRVGVSLPYICHTGVHSRVLWKPCPHFCRQNSGPLVQEGGRYWMHDAVLNTLKRPSVNAVSKLIGTVLDKREALFTYWDPLPYCAYYHFQLPLRSIKTFLQKRQSSRSMATTLAAPVH